MEFINATRMVGGYNFAVDRTGRDSLVIVIKGTFALPRAGESVTLLDEQVPLVMSDTFTGEPGITSPVHEIDFAPIKRACDVLVLGHARPPDTRPVARMVVGVRVGRLVKSFDVVGDRVWNSGVRGFGSSSPATFTAMPISYDRAFGGTITSEDDPQWQDAFPANPVGRGWSSSHRLLDGRPLPNTEMSGARVSDPRGSYVPMAFGPLGRGWAARRPFAGTYDDRWRRDAFPFLPADFDERYYQAAPSDQQIEIPSTPLEIGLSGFTSDGPRQFTLPFFEAPVHVFPRAGGHEQCDARLDTIVLEPDEARCTLTWRHTRPLRRGPHDIAQVVVGRKSPAWWRAQHGGKPYFASLADLKSTSKARGADSRGE